jgi:signal transduction histidine kinase
LLNEKLLVVGGLTRHDISNKLASIGGNEFLLRKRLGNQPALVRYLDGIKTAIEASDKLFEFSRFYEKIGSEKPANMDVFECFNVAAALFSNQNQIKIVNKCQNLKVLADSLLMQIFYNLIDNSIKHGEKVTLIRLKHKIDKDMIKLFYEDNGVGIPQTNKDEIFKVGFTTGKGSGLGLALIKRMIEVYGWSIQENGQQNNGAKFTITIPKPDNIIKENH